jgi:hypothetical protein
MIVKVTYDKEKFQYILIKSDPTREGLKNLSIILPLYKFIT